MEGTIKRPYEAVILMHPDATAEDQKGLFKKNKEIIEGLKGQVNHLDTWGKRVMATPAAGITKAFYFHTTFMADPQTIKELERTMNINDKVIRFMHTRLDERTTLSKYMESFKAGLAASAARERERQERPMQRKRQNFE